MKYILIIILNTICYHILVAQNEQRCGFQNSVNLQQEIAIKNLLTLKSKEFTAGRTEEISYKIPVLFHIIHTSRKTDQVNYLKISQIKAQIDVLNEDFNRLNADTVDTPTDFKAVAGKLPIQFELAKIDTNNTVLPEAGIIHHYNFDKITWQKAEFEQEVMPKTIRNPNNYLNIWVFNEMYDNNSPILGFAQFPDFSNLIGLNNIGGLEFTDGVMIAARTIYELDKRKTTEPISYWYGFGRTLTHELGHFFGILHTFGQNSCDTDADFCADTPRLKAATENRCSPTNANKCETLFMPQNYMDYTYDACMNLFTKNQIERMKIVLEKCPRRKELTKSMVANLRNENLANRISIFPNPSNGFFYIQTEDLPIKNLKIFSVLGQEISHITAFQANQSINISYLAKAMYILQIETTEGTVIKKLVID
jgi:zinc-dependent metalloproteinase lipoprotein